MSFLSELAGRSRELSERCRASLRGQAYRAQDAGLLSWERLLQRLQLRPPLPLGAAGERAAAGHLGRLGYHIIRRGFTDRLGELDVVAVDGRTVVYVEVKTRRSEATERPGAAVDHNKRTRICLAANAFARAYHVDRQPSRFDIVEVIWPRRQRRPTIRHWPAAFESTLRH